MYVLNGTNDARNAPQITPYSVEFENNKARKKK